MPGDNLGLRLSTVSYDGNHPCPIDNFAHLYATNIINDSINWNRISGTIIADSAYTFLCIGNFFDDLHTDTLHYTCDSCINLECYYYFDDICLSTDSNLCNGGLDSLPCNVRINENTFIDGIITFPNPTSQLLTISFSENQEAEIRLIDVLGNELLSRTMIDKRDCVLNISSISSGYYLLQIINKRNGANYLKRIIKI